MKKHIQINLPNDRQGFTNFKCPICKKYFKINSSEYRNRINQIKSYCPYCGLSSKQFITDELSNVIDNKIDNMISDILNESDKSMKKQTRRNKNIKYNAPKSRSKKPEQVFKNRDETFLIRKLSCCSKEIKVDNISYILPIYCPYCGGIEYEFKY